MEDGCRDGDLHGSVRHNLGLLPAAIFGPIDLQHVFRECLTKCKMAIFPRLRSFNASLVELNIARLERAVALQLVDIDGVLGLHLLDEMSLREGADHLVAEQEVPLVRECSQIH